jgi:uncharacterized protein DUF4249
MKKKVQQKIVQNLNMRCKVMMFNSRISKTFFERQKRLMPLLILLCLSLFSFLSCEEEFIPEITTDPLDIVVEGYIEAGDLNLPPYVFLTRSQPFFTELDFGNFDNFFVHDAMVTVSDGTNTITLEEICWEDFDEEQQALLNILLAQSGIGNFDSIPGNLCVYVDSDFEMVGEIGKTYSLHIEVEDKVISASTKLENRVPLDSLWFIVPEGEVLENLRELRVLLSDPPGEINFYRYLTSVNGGGFLSGLNSVADDALFDGQKFEFPLPKSEPRNAEVDQSTYGLYELGDTVSIKWTTIDQSNFNFWNTLEFNAINQGPFSSYTRVASNIDGGIGIWGAYAAHYYSLVVE